MIRRVAVIGGLLLLLVLLVIGLVADISRQSAHPVRLVIAASLALGACWLIAKVDIPWLVRAVQSGSTALPVFAYLVTTWMVGPAAGTVAFDEIAAQVIAVFLLALALEARFFRLRRIREPLELGATLLTMVILAVGEFYALQGIAREYADHADVIGGAIAAGFVAVAVSALVGEAQADRPK